MGQRFSNYNRALGKLEQAIEYIKSSFFTNGKYDESLFKQNDDIIKEGLIQRFEYTHELAWKVLADFLKESGNENIHGSKDATKVAFNEGLIIEGQIWMNMIKSLKKCFRKHTNVESVILYGSRAL